MGFWTSNHKLILWIFSALLLLNVFVVGIFLYIQNKTLTYEHEVVEETDEDLFLQEEEMIIIEPEDKGKPEMILPVEKVLFEYIEVIDGCDIHFEGDCLLVRSGPGTDYSIVGRLRNNIVLKVDGKVERDGQDWYKVVFDEWLRYPERVEGEWYVSAQYVEILLDEGDKTVWEDGQATTSKRIVIESSEQKLSAYAGDELFIETPISTGLDLTPTPRGTFTVYKKTPSRYMQGPLPGLPSDQYYDMPGVPWNLYFTQGGAVIHGAYWHNSFGSPYSHGCVNLPPDIARQLYLWTELGTEVIVK